MWKDTIVEEVRDIRLDYAKQFDYDIRAIYADIKEQEIKSGIKVVSLPSRCATHVGSRG